MNHFVPWPRRWPNCLGESVSGLPPRAKKVGPIRGEDDCRMLPGLRPRTVGSQARRDENALLFGFLEHNP